MAKYPDLITTKKGLDLNSAANAAQKAVIFTKVTVGDGDVPSDTSVMDLTAVVSPKMNLDITNKENKGNGQFTIRATLGNDTLEQGFYAKEIGVYAKLDGDKEVLYAYTNGGNYVDYIPDKSSPIDAQVFNIEVIIGNLQQATIVIEDETHITEKDLQDHNTSDSAHENRFGLFEKIADLGNDIIKKLALTTTITVISSLQTESWFGQMLKWVLTASGMRYNLAQTGYICLGSFFGGLIIQWGSTATESSYLQSTPLAIAYTSWYRVTTTGAIALGDTTHDQTTNYVFDASTLSKIAFRTNYDSAPTIFFITVGQ